MVVTQLLSAQELLSLSPSQLETLDTMIEAEIINSDEIMRVLKQQFQKNCLPAIREIQGSKTQTGTR